MIRLATLFWLVLVSATGFVMFGVKYEVQALDDELARTRKAAAAERHETRVLDAEWAYLTRPEILEDMNRRFLSLGPIATKQLRTGVSDIPMRPAPPPPPEVAAAPEAAPQQGEAAPHQGEANVASASPGPPAEAAPAAAAAAAAKPARAVAAAAAKPAPAPAKLAARREAPQRRPKSLDDLFAQVSAIR